MIARLSRPPPQINSVLGLPTLRIDRVAAWTVKAANVAAASCVDRPAT